MGSKKRKKPSGNPAKVGNRVSSTTSGHMAAGRAPTEDGDSVQAGSGTQPQQAVSTSTAPRTAGDVVAPRPRAVRRTDDFFVLPTDETHDPPHGCAAAFDELEPHGLAATYTFTAPESGAYTTEVRFVGRRKDTREGQPGPRDRFDRSERVALTGDGGQVSITTRIQGLAPGSWRVVAQATTALSDGTTREGPRRVVETHTRWGHLVHGPRVQPWSWPILVGLGALVALIMQAWLANRIGIDVGSILGLSLLGCLLGFIGGKLWYLALHRKPITSFLRSGACIQGFLLVSLSVLVLGSLSLDMPVRSVLDVTTPGIFFGVAVGRPGCFLTGCCTGRPTASRWGLVSSDRRLAVRRIPVQLLEAATGFVIGSISLLAVLIGVSVAGTLFAGAVAGYTLVRQLLFPLRGESRTRGGRLVTMTAAGLVLSGAIAVSVAA